VAKGPFKKALRKCQPLSIELHLILKRWIAIFYKQSSRIHYLDQFRLAIKNRNKTKHQKQKQKKHQNNNTKNNNTETKNQSKKKNRNFRCSFLVSYFLLPLLYVCYRIETQK
jgi:hypothetical protein